jgi:signal transduction histidine kinase
VHVQADNGLRRYGIIAGQAVFWIMTIARLLMCGLVYLWASSAYPVGATYTSLARTIFLIWTFWSAVTAAAALAGKPIRLQTCRFVVAVDAILAMVTIAALKGDSGATIAFAICVVVFGLSLRVGRTQIFGLITLLPLAFILRDAAVFIFGIEFRRNGLDSIVPELISAALQILSVTALILWANRRYVLEKFTNDFSSLRMLSLERSFDFDLQSWTEQFALLFRPARAACLMTSPVKSAPSRYYHHNLDAWLSDSQRIELMRAFGDLPNGCSLFDCEHNRINPPGERTWRAFDESEHRVAVILRRAGISAALVQPMQIDRARGGLVCALGRPIDAAKIAELFHLGRHISEMSDFLSRIATAERAFIADAHDVARRDLHDGVLQSLAALRMRLMLITKRKDVAKTDVDLEIRKTVDILTLEQSRLRGILETDQSTNHTINLVSQLDICVRSISLQWSIDVKLSSEEPAIPVDPESALNIEHLLREVIANAVRHAKSNSLTVSLSLKQDALMMAVSDLNPLSEGEQGFEKPALTLKSASLRDRLRLVNGEAYAEGLGKGTLLSIRIPMQQVDDA